MQVFLHHVYEYLKGVRQMVLHTTLSEHLCEMEARSGRRASPTWPTPWAVPG